ncbi:LapD/MoxY N-terminal periplasmic domain-containing protein [Paracoccus sp. DMF-8]|uniref:LapD/MoxY N-terminal periplasmic domain-containing protein n=1 Tax=Paracoccus sp. DMF-8 TaxID=3019445 RepID=UPI0023E787CE|nr:LapD/MoxY N-terminal periplasmic domain-containing protein [Paracoccus sp. DMF-8]MDF3606827.1 LapD/MoxY N-terminal periplasmic domain-containing protein [Paracoccus sp. DMF-8]
MATILIVNAREAVNQEIQSAYGIARASASMRLPQETRGTDDTMAIARQLADELDGLRHVAADITDPRVTRSMRPTMPEPQDEDPPPAWFAALMRPEMSEDRLAITRYPNVLGFLHISTDPNDEIAEAWEDFRIVLPVLIGTALSLIALAVGLTVFVLRRLQLVQDAMAHIQAGDLTRRAPDSQFVELASLAEAA